MESKPVVSRRRFMAQSARATLGAAAGLSLWGTGRSWAGANDRVRVAALEDTLRGKMKAWSERERRQSKRLKDLADIARLVEAHPRLWDLLTDELKQQVQRPEKS
jgi:hypothetical protein